MRWLWQVQDDARANAEIRYGQFQSDLAAIFTVWIDPVLNVPAMTVKADVEIEHFCSLLVRRAAKPLIGKRDAKRFAAFEG